MGPNLTYRSACLERQIDARISRVGLQISVRQARVKSPSRPSEFRERCSPTSRAGRALCNGARGLITAPHSPLSALERGPITEADIAALHLLAPQIAAEQATRMVAHDHAQPQPLGTA